MSVMNKDGIELLQGNIRGISNGVKIPLFPPFPKGDVYAPFGKEPACACPDADRGLGEIL